MKKQLNLPQHFLNNKFASSFPPIHSKRAHAIEIHTYNCYICGRGYTHKSDAEHCYVVCSIRHCVRCNKEFKFDYTLGLFVGCTTFKISPGYGSKFDSCESYFCTVEEVAQLESCICDDCLEHYLMTKEEIKNG